MKALEETTVIIKTENGSMARPALIHEYCPGLSVTMTSFGRFSVTHIKSGTKMCPHFKQFDDALLVFSQFAMIAKDNGFSWDVEESEIRKIVKLINDKPLPFEIYGTEEKKTFKDFLDNMKYYSLKIFCEGSDIEEDALELLEKCEPDNKVTGNTCKEQNEEAIKSPLSERWHIHTATGCSVRSETGQIIFEYPLSIHREKFNADKYNGWLDYADYICDLHNRFIDRKY